MLSSDDLPRFQQAMLNWFREHQRPLPWRQGYQPYHVWISEIMLQQTQVVTVLPYFQRWIERLPTLQEVAKAEESVILKLWEGLGYYSRVRNLQRAAREILEKHGGEFPQDLEAILALPGIGRYTAGAIASIAFNQEAPIVDGNVVRVLCRITDEARPAQTIPVQKKLWELAEAWIPQGQARDFNQAMMELGATVCLPQQPLCLMCPVREFCQAFKAGTSEARPVKTPRKAAKPVFFVLGVIRQGERFLIQQRPKEGLMGGLWEFPNFEVTAEELTPEVLSAKLEKTGGLEVTRPEAFLKVKHAYTSFKATIQAFTCEVLNGSEVLGVNDSRRWATLEEMQALSWAVAYQKVLTVLKASHSC